MSRRTLLAAATLAVGLVVTGCAGTEHGGADHDGAGPTSQTATTQAATTQADTSPTAETAGVAVSAAGSQHNAVDVMFVSMMIPHHQGALEMSEVALTQASTPEVKELAGTIQAAQAPEIALMQSWLTEWGVDPADLGEMGGMGHGDGHGAPTTGATGDFGMGSMMTMSEADLQELAAAQGVAFDRLFLEQMIVHHQGAVDMADVVLANGTNAAVHDLAEAIKTGQTAEIATMQDLLAGL